MQHARSTLFKAIQSLSVAAAFAFSLSLAHADEYTDVNQLLRAGKLTEASIKVDLFLATKPRDPQMRFLKGVIQRDSGKTADAITTFTKLTEDYPELPEPYNNLAVLYAAQGQYDKARTALEMAIRTNPSYSTAHENLGDVYAKLASQAYNKALQLDGNNAAVQPKLALIREVFTPNLKGPHGVAPAAATAPPPPAPAPAPAPAATPVPAPAPAKPAPAPVAAPTPPPAAAAAATPAPSAAVAKASAPVPAAKPAAPDDAAKTAEHAVRAWASAWASKDIPAYLAAYAKDFNPPGKQTRGAWEEERRRKIKGKSNIAVKLENLSVRVDGAKAVVKFRQDYRADSLSVSSRKTLDLVKVGDKWLIQRESTGS
jgi:tetratricopeptide (TPR) repeat protein